LYRITEVTALDCTITVKKKGQLKQDWTGTIKEAIKDWDVFYRAVFNHVKDCDKCDPDEVLQAYWELRQKPRHGGRTSVGLAALAYRYSKLGTDPDLVKKFIAKSGVVIRYAQIFTDEELYQVLCDDINHEFQVRPTSTWIFSGKAREIMRYLEKWHRPFLHGVAHVFEAELMPPYEDVERLAVVAEVTVS
jgi:hypothetical protein